MRFLFPYTVLPALGPIPSLAGRQERPRPLVPVVILSPADPTKWVHYRACLDTGADDCVFHEDTATLLGIDLTNAPSKTARGTTGATMTFRYADVWLQLRDSAGNSIEWAATVAFTQNRASYPLLGYAGFLQFFNATFLGEDEQVELEENNSIGPIRRHPTLLSP